MNSEITKLHGLIANLEALGCWHTANVLRAILINEIELAKGGL